MSNFKSWSGILARDLSLGDLSIAPALAGLALPSARPEAAGAAPGQSLFPRMLGKRFDWRLYGPVPTLKALRATNREGV
jgi:hypothetical protein